MNGRPRNTILVGDVRTRLSEVADHSVDCIITSPPYFRLRNYGIVGQMGLEGTINEWVDELRNVSRGLARVLKPTGSVWLNLGDSYSRHVRSGAPPKSRLLGPERLVVALVEDGWTIRNVVTWQKTNSLPSSVRDRLAVKSEVIYFLTRTRQYYFDLDAIRVPHSSKPGQQGHRQRTVGIPTRTPPAWAGPLAGNNSGLARMKATGRIGHPLGKNPGDVWTTAASNYRGQHFATFPPGLVARPLLASCPERVCMACGGPWRPHRSDVPSGPGALQPSCTCRADWEPGLVLDPFMGSGTVGLVAERHRRDWLGIEINPDFAAEATDRIAAAQRAGPARRGLGRAA